MYIRTTGVVLFERIGINQGRGRLRACGGGGGGGGGHRCGGGGAAVVGATETAVHGSSSSVMT